MLHRTVSLPILTFVLLAVPSIVSAQDRIADIKEVAAEGIRLPWHTTDLYWTSEKTVGNVKTIGVTFTVDRDVPDTVNLYIAPLGGQHLNDIMFYGGIQTNVNGWPSPTEKRRVHRGPGAIFSLWGKKPVDISSARPEKDGLCESAGYEGHFASVRRPYIWKAGTYTWGIRKEKTEQVEGAPVAWFACYLTDHDRKVEHRIGALRFEGETFKFNGRSTSFVEIYATSKINRPKVPSVSVVFQPPKVNGKLLSIRDVRVYHPRKGSKGSPSPPIGRAQSADGEIKVELKNEVFTGSEVPKERYVLQFKNSKPTDTEKVQTGLKNWETLKKKHAGNYSYTVAYSSAFGFGYVTEVEVRDDKVAARRYKEFGAPEPLEPAAEPEPNAWLWEEKGDKIGMNKNGAPAKTLDELYDEARKVIARELAEHEKRYVALDSKGLLMTCFYIDTQIQDDAPTHGLSVSSITFAAPATALRVAPTRAIFDLATRKKPMRITSLDEAARVFEEKEVLKLKKSVDFAKQAVLVFAWKGSGRDELSVDLAASSSARVIFKYKYGRTKDLRPHVHVYALPSGAKWSIE